MAELNEPIEIKLGYAPENDAFALAVPDINMRIDLPQAGLPDFLDWLRGGWRNGPFGSFDVVWSPRLNAMLLLFSVNPKARVACILFGLTPEAWDRLITDLDRRADELRRDFIEPFQRLLEQGLSKEEATMQLERANPFGLQAMWRAPN